jgi:hypothetical protein
MDTDLKSWLETVWNEKQRTGSHVSYSKIYSYYERTVDPVERTFTAGTNLGENEYPDVEPPEDIVESAFEGNLGAATYVNRTLDASNETSEDPLELGGINTRAGYLYVPSPSHHDDASTHRVVIHARPYNRLIRVMRLVVRDIVKAGGRFADVNGAKVMTPACFRSGRNDTLIIYTKNKKTADSVTRELLMWMAEGLLQTEHFVALFPKTIKKVCKGIGYACEPPNVQVLKSYPNKLSYGKFLSQVIEIATVVACAAGDSRVTKLEDFLGIAAAVLSKAGIDPQSPYEFGTMNAAFKGSIPWSYSSPVTARASPLYRTLVHEMKW